MLEKNAIRKEYLKKRKLLESGKVSTEKFLLHFEKFLNSKIISNVTKIISYIPNAHEMDISQINNFILNFGLDLYIPFINKGDEMLFYKWGGQQSELVKHENYNFYQLKKDFRHDTITPNKADLIILPAVCVDKSGNRIGYGKGFYDKALAECKNIKLSVISENFIFNGNFKAEAHDVKLDYIVTDQRIIICK